VRQQAKLVGHGDADAHSTHIQSARTYRHEDRP
jgi:hypothetical protein